MNIMLPIINLAIVEESPLIRLGIEQFVRSLYQQVCCQIQVASMEQLSQRIQDRPIDVLVSGLSGSRKSAQQVAEQLIKLGGSRPEIRQIIYTYSHCGEQLDALSRLTPVSLISRQESEEQLKHCFTQALGGFRVCSPKMQTIIDEYAKEDLAVWQRLTFREREVLHLLFRGLSITETARHLRRNIKTISAHKRHSMQKLGVCDDVELFSLRIHFSGVERTFSPDLWR